MGLLDVGLSVVEWQLKLSNLYSAMSAYFKTRVAIYGSTLLPNISCIGRENLTSNLTFSMRENLELEMTLISNSTNTLDILRSFVGVHFDLRLNVY